jgi:hypothetical protein
MRYTLTTTDEVEHRNAINGGRWRSVVEEMDNHLRGRIKYEDLPEPVETDLQAARDDLHRLVNTAGLSLWGDE